MALSVFFRTSCSWRSEGLFGQSFSVAPPIQAPMGLPCLGSLSAVRRVRHIDGPPGWVLLCRSVHQALTGAPWVGSYSVVQCLRYLMAEYRPRMCPAQQLFTGHCMLFIIQLLMPGCRESETMDSAALSCSHGCLAFLHRHFSSPSPPLPPLNPSLHSHQQPSPWDCSTLHKL